MLFNSYSFIFIYLPIVLLGYFQLAKIKHTYAAAWLAFASLFFYGYWNPAYIGLLLGSIICNYAFGMWIAKTPASGKSEVVGGGRKPLLVVAIAANLALLAYYKYANFFIGSVNSVAGTQWSLGEIILPLGISFFTFTQIAFLVDTYQGKVKEYNFIHYVLFVTYFPHLIAGPILHHKEMMPQFAHISSYRLNWDHVATGLMLFTLGLCKKTLGADALAPFANGVFSGVQNGLLPTSYEAWAGALAYTLQLYFDFSGYTNMALGIALLFNIKLPINFDSPYKATSIIDFWRRWHMTLSRFLRDYLYIPLGGNRKGPLRRYLNLFTTMLLGGLWHGAGVTFIVWGALHGAFLTLNHLWRETISERYLRWVPNWIGALTGGLLTFIAVVAAWVVFRSSDIHQARIMLEAMFGINARQITFDSVLHGQLLLVTDLSGRDLLKLLILSLAWVWLLPNSSRLVFIKRNLILTVAQAVAVVYLMCLAIDQFGSYSPFLYFQF
ncbi:MBOAT family O-acyltransferase [Gallionella capsiferriformans]|uniref:Probable alginate O-acetylase AlgI n=1 Tax=Gallionella capsiferriformans (strain ES-2) TaxID=395494 RepID=D9SDY5_GALCS|nr:MBOAT family O-acyltransferase [Gallionella capsiferriformans]ADL56807.1 membrane bound O-acyl transferase MBOAT family protein [Gallionella capsiferriformans ES-2]